MTSGFIGNEEWRPVIGFEGIYEVSNLGRVRRVKAGQGARIGKTLAADLRRDKCWMVNLCRDGRPKTYYVHRLVAEAFIRPIPETHTVNHKDGDRSNNLLENLEVVTWHENREHARLTGLIPKGVGHCHARLNPDAVRDIRARADTATRRQLAQEYGVTEASVRAVINRRNWKHVL